ncbi:MAG: hypothetical protein JSS30_07060 [Verrucomicrobia bacterium]|nr:hypothetical protein [Verrucomicrobiota bacterium]
MIALRHDMHDIKIFYPAYHAAKRSCKSCVAYTIERMRVKKIAKKRS